MIEILDRFLVYAKRVADGETLADYEQMVFGFCDTFIRAGIYNHQIQMMRASKLLQELEEERNLIEPIKGSLVNVGK